jgi:hypothetical protein
MKRCHRERLLRNALSPLGLDLAGPLELQNRSDLLAVHYLVRAVPSSVEPLHKIYQLHLVLFVRV